MLITSSSSPSSNANLFPSDKLLLHLAFYPHNNGIEWTNNIILEQSCIMDFSIKILDKFIITASLCQKMLVYDALEGRFLTIKLRPKQQGCCVCGDNPTINKLQDYELFCGASATDKVRKL